MDAIGGATVGNVVEIEFKDFIFGVDNFGGNREKGLADFSSKSTTSVFENGVFD